ncbi:glutathione S transferase [Citrobacter freundii]|uniref:Glutathione S-transferase n=1 Tax=Pseudomonas monteilii TaxID=76759 RepID=A0AAP7FL27_9PSED|nr:MULTISPECIES: glutathione S-transferase family protein [Gammaproteobacteria]EHF4985731.1 glutathione S-transferase family protein [Enterobacter hormaechei]EKY1501811.1 glutathione S-transferase family protein [Enterobacter cloacae]VTM29403.1 glutathione S-transferase [Klebsiella pneumoniae]HDT2670331.1 glutathione S-transferase family protein [Klebsiella pneumoniae subsp. pneumoniae]AIQ99570.1 glutathione S-transferase [Pluralibacter gergoviae]
MITIYHLGVSQSERVVWLCEELGLAYALRRFERDPMTRLAPPEYKSISPTRTSPVVRDGDIVLSESGAIMEYLIHRHGGGRLAVAPEHANYPVYLFWFHFANSSLTAMEMARMMLVAAGGRDGEGSLAFAEERIDTAFGLVENQLGRTAHIAGEAFTAADIMLLFPLTTMRHFMPKDLAGYPNILGYLKRIGEREAYRRAMAKADPGMLPLLA